MPKSITRYFQGYWPAGICTAAVPWQKIPSSSDHGHGKDKQTPSSAPVVCGGVLHSARLSREKALHVDLQPTFFTKCCKVGVSPGWQPGVWPYAPNRQESNAPQIKILVCFKLCQFLYLWRSWVSYTNSSTDLVPVHPRRRFSHLSSDAFLSLSTQETDLSMSRSPCRTCPWLRCGTTRFTRRQ